MAVALDQGVGNGAATPQMSETEGIVTVDQDLRARSVQYHGTLPYTDSDYGTGLEPAKTISGTLSY
jgi:hypothetical protein